MILYQIKLLSPLFVTFSSHLIIYGVIQVPNCQTYLTLILGTYCSLLIVHFA